MTKYLIPYFFFFFLIVVFAGCSSEDEPYPQMPFVNVYEEIYLNDAILQADLNNPTKRFVYLNAGVDGIILHKTSDGRYLALERRSPYEVDKGCTVEVDENGFFILDPCSGSMFDMKGNPTSGPNTYPLYQYQTTRQGDYLIITN